MTVSELLSQRSNDYSNVELEFYSKTGFELLSDKPFSSPSSSSISIIIPCFKSNNTIQYTIESILNQTQFQSNKLIELIIVDDCSPTPLLEKIQLYEDKINIKYIRSSKNLGAGKAREIGSKIAKNEILIFLDSDIIIPSDFVSNHTVVHDNTDALIVLISFRENIFPKDLHSIKKKAPNPRNGDHRIYMKFKEEWVMRKEDEHLVGTEFELLKMTNYFKSFGNSTKIENWTLPLMVLTCAMSVKRNWSLQFMSVPNELKRCSFDDTCIASKMIAYGAKVIPLNNSNVFHYLEQHHTRSDKAKNLDYLENEIVYLKLLNENLHGN